MICGVYVKGKVISWELGFSEKGKGIWKVKKDRK